jgi:phage shock protein PspC (stress-responsive transcriptional regulator)
MRRSSTDRVIAGVCGGLAAQWGCRTFWVRLGMLVLGLHVVGLVVYGALWIAAPSE